MKKTDTNAPVIARNEAIQFPKRNLSIFRTHNFAWIIWKNTRMSKENYDSKFDGGGVVMCYAEKVFFYNFYFMESIDNISYSLRDRYFSLNKEKRIGKRQFQTRVFVPGILAILPIIVVNSIVVGLFLGVLKSNPEAAIVIMTSS